MAGQAMFGGRGAGDFLSKATSYIAAFYMILALLIGVVYKNETVDQQESLIQQRMQENQESAVPSALPVAPIEEGSVLPQSAPVSEPASEEAN